MRTHIIQDVIYFIKNRWVKQEKVHYLTYTYFQFTTNKAGRFFSSGEKFYTKSNTWNLTVTVFITDIFS